MAISLFSTLATIMALRSLLVELSTTECSEAPSATRKVAMEKTSAKYQPPQARLSGDLEHETWTACQRGA